MQLRVTDLKQWAYCPRVLYWTYCLPVEKKVSYKMERGVQEHEVLGALERRRTARRYGLEHAERRFRVPLVSEHLDLSGIVDLVLIAGSEHVPVEFKNTEKPRAANHRFQLTGYAVLLEDVYDCEVSRGFIYAIPLGRIIPVAITKLEKSRVRRAIDRIHWAVETEWLPAPTRQRAKCVDCEFRRYCADV